MQLWNTASLFLCSSMLYTLKCTSLDQIIAVLLVKEFWNKHKIKILAFLDTAGIIGVCGEFSVCLYFG